MSIEPPAPPTYAALEAAGWVRFEGDPPPGHVILESPEGVRFYRPSGERLRSDAARLEAWEATFQLVGRESHRAFRERRMPNVLMFTPDPRHRHGDL